MDPDDRAKGSYGRQQILKKCMQHKWETNSFRSQARVPACGCVGRVQIRTGQDRLRENYWNFLGKQGSVTTVHKDVGMISFGFTVKIGDLPRNPEMNYMVSPGLYISILYMVMLKYWNAE